MLEERPFFKIGLKSKPRALVPARQATCSPSPENEHSRKITCDSIYINKIDISSEKRRRAAGVGVWEESGGSCLLVCEGLVAGHRPSASQ